MIETVDGFRRDDSISSSDLNQKLIKLSDLLLLPIEEGLSKNISQLIIIPHELISTFFTNLNICHGLFLIRMIFRAGCNSKCQVNLGSVSF